MRPIALILAGLLTLTLVLPSPAAPKRKPKRKKQPAAAADNPVLRKAFGPAYAKAKLTRTQETRLAELIRNYGPKMEKALDNVRAVYTPEQRDLVERARAMAIRAGVKPENVGKRVEEARRGLEFTPEQKRALAKAEQEKQALSNEIRKKAAAFLKPPQVQILFGSGKKQAANPKKRPGQIHDPI